MKKADKNTAENIKEMFRLKGVKERSDSAYQQRRLDLIDALDKEEEDVLFVPDGDDDLVARRTIITVPKYDYNKLRQTLPRDIFKRIVKREIDNKKVEALFETGQLRIEDLVVGTVLEETIRVEIKLVERKIKKKTKRTVKK